MLKSFQEEQTALFANGEPSSRLSLAQKVSFWNAPMEYAVLSVYEKMFSLILYKEFLSNNSEYPYDRGER